MVLSVLLGNEIVRGTPFIDKTGALLFDPAPHIGPFGFYPYHWTFWISTRPTKEYEYQFLYAVAETRFMKMKEASLSIPPSVCGQVFIKMNHYPGDGIYYSEHEEFEEKAYVDLENGIIAVGDPWRKDVRCIEFADNEFVLIDNFNHLNAVLVRVREGRLAWDDVKEMVLLTTHMPEHKGTVPLC